MNMTTITTTQIRLKKFKVKAFMVFSIIIFMFILQEKLPYLQALHKPIWNNNNNSSVAGEFETFK